ncbi:MAG: hypothetical protein LIO77_10835, partial [Rikenellaceae bacterium]|nr:hypothetical protein [Rikenellaceae bacterium]
MKKCIHKLALACLAVFSATGCTNEDTSIVVDSSQLYFSYSMPGGMTVQTYAVEAMTHENRIYDLYVLFFDPAAGDTYKGCARSGVSTTSTSGSSRVSMPEGCDVMDRWKMLFVANLDEYLLDGETDAGDWLDGLLTSQDMDYAIEELMGMSETAIQSPLLMSGQADKPADTNEISVELARRVARIDLINSASNFTLVSAQVWNARTYAYLMEEGGIPDGTTANSFSNYTDNTAAPTDGKIQGKLYAFPNTSIPTTGDINTTCLIIGGVYTGSGGTGSVTYYRVNVCANLAMYQELKGNSIYTIDITNVTSDGEGSPGDAHNKDNLNITYSLNNWDDSYSVLYVYDVYGNALGVSQRFINFSYRGPQEATINVFRLYSDSNPLTGDWTLETLTGSYASSFSATKDNDKLTIEVLDENTLAVDRDAQVYLRWGTIYMLLEVTQLSYASQVDNALVSPTTLSFALLGASPKQLTVSLQGDFSGVTRSDIETAFIYHDSSDTGWLHIDQGSTVDDEALGMFYFNVWPDDYNDYTDGVRQAEIRFVIRVGGSLTTAHVDVYQSPDSFGDGELRIVEIICMEKDEETGEYLNRGATSSLAAKMPGLPVGQNTANHLHFRMVGSDFIKYVMYINSSLDWEIVASGVTAEALDFTPSSGKGDYAHAVEVEITAVSDVD